MFAHHTPEKLVDSGSVSTAAVSIRDVVKIYGAGPGAFTALKGATFDVSVGEFFTLLGPSGCGKTTLLRLIGGFQDITSGSILLDGDDIATLPANRRPVNTVFQNYALFPHMSVVDNISFGLKRLGKSAAETRARTEEMVNLTQLQEFADRRPNQLSGGQQQRVALARALAPSPKVLLLDEPLSALDLKLRQAMRIELKRIQEETGITFIFVTHDQEEALTMSDRIAVMSAGELQQIGTAKDIYESPRNRFVADFIGETNLLPVTVTETIDGAGTTQCVLADGSNLRCETMQAVAKDGKAHISIRPERISLQPVEANDGSAISGIVDRMIYLGTDTQTMLHLDDGSEITVRAQNAHAAAVDFSPGDRAALKIDDGAVRLLVD